MDAQNYLEDIDYKGKGSIWAFLKRIFIYALRYKKWFWGFVISVALVGVSDAIWPLIWMHFLDDVIVPTVEKYQEMKSQGADFQIDNSGLWLYFGFFMGNGIFQVVAVYYFILYAGRIQEYVLYDLRKEMHAKLQHLSYKFYDKSAMGWLLSRLTSDSDRVSELISWGFLDCMWGITMIIFILTIMFYYSWILALVLLLSLPILFLISIKLRLLVIKYSRKSRKINSELTANFTEHIQGVEVNKLTNQEERVSSEFNALSLGMRKTTYKATFYTAMYTPIVILVGSISALLIINIGGRMAISVPAGITIGILAACFGYATRIFEPVLDITRFYAMAQNSLSAGERIFGLLDEKVEIDDLPNAKSIEKINGSIEFKNVDFYYNKDKRILENFNLKIEAGTSVALVGATGSGKTTIANLVGRFYEIQNGDLLIDGISITNIKLQSLRNQMGIVLQTPHLFEGSIRENILYGNLNASEEEIKNTLKLIDAEHFVERLNEDVGESGDNISMGERQLVSLARAIMANPSILIMDEATSSVDYITEQKIQKGIDALINNRTSIIVAHRLSTIKNCDRIILIDQGKILEDGNHQELMQKQGAYFELYNK